MKQFRMRCPNCLEAHKNHDQGDINVCFRKMCERGVKVIVTQLEGEVV